MNEANEEKGQNTRKAHLGEIFSSVEIYRDFREAFRKATGLQVTLSPKGKTQSFGSALNQSPFCTVMVKTNESHVACQCILQRDLEREAQSFLEFFIALAFLANGQVFLHWRTKSLDDSSLEVGDISLASNE